MKKTRRSSKRLKSLPRGQVSKARSTVPKPVWVVPEGAFKFPTSRSVSDYPKSLRFVLRWEGGVVNDPDDPGGATNKGVTQKTYNGYCRKKGIPLRSVEQISDAEVGDIYKSLYWDMVGGDREIWPLCLVLFDTGVNMGPGRAQIFLTQAKKSMDSDPANDALELARRVIDLRVNRYYFLVQRNPRLKKFLKGWLNRARELKRVIGY